METYFGRISLPDSEEIIETVRLTKDENIIEIEFASREWKFRDIKIIQGIFNGLGEITLINCQNISGISGAGAEVNRYKVNYLLIGVQLENPSEYYFESASIQMPGLLDWTKLYSVDSNNGGNERSINIKELEKIPVYNSSSYSIQIYAATKLSFSRKNNQTKITENAGFEICSSGTDKINIWEYIELIKELQKVLLIIGNKNTVITSTTFYKAGINPVNLLWEESQSIGNPSTMGPIIEFEEIKNDLNLIFSTWFTNKDIHTSIDLILEKSINTKLSRENYFLNNCFAIETYHRRFKNYKLFEKDEFRSLKKEILKSIKDENIAKVIENNLAHINEPNFRKRLLDFIDDFNIILPAEFEVENYLIKIVKTRNYLVHRGEPKNIFDKFDMLYAAIFLELIIKISIYRTLGVKEETIKKLLKKNGERIQGFYQSNKRMKFEY